MTYAIVRMNGDRIIGGFLFADTLSELLQKLRFARAAASLLPPESIDDLDTAIDEIAWKVERGIVPEPGPDHINDYVLLVEG